MNEFNRGAERKTSKISEQVAREIVHDMRKMEVGAKLPAEAAMLASLGVSRGSLREALRILEVHGLIVIRPGPGGGPIVAEVSSRDFARMSTLYFHRIGATYQEVAESRLIMEPVMARLAAERQDPEHIAELQVYVNESFDISDPDEYFNNSAEFHSIVSGMSGNRVLDLIGRSLKDVFIDRIEGLGFPLDRRKRVYDEHAKISKAIIAGEAGVAEQLMRAHMQDYVNYNTNRDPKLFSDTVDWR